MFVFDGLTQQSRPDGSPLVSGGMSGRGARQPAPSSSKAARNRLAFHLGSKRSPRPGSGLGSRFGSAARA
jgi:hypothetical protein